jgi:hypothetical protein
MDFLPVVFRPAFVVRPVVSMEHPIPDCHPDTGGKPEFESWPLADFPVARMKKPGLLSETGLFPSTDEPNQPRVRERIMKLS